jgi:catechol 2,3-dioxygenase-like lactoylglutathione lyase family enzyme
VQQMPGRDVYLDGLLDHCVIHVTDWERSNAFYTGVLGAELIARSVVLLIVSATGSSTCTDQASPRLRSRGCRWLLAIATFALNGMGGSRTRSGTWNGAAWLSKRDRCS